MAEGPERRDGKLESFLSKALPAEEYERLLARQPAVVVLGGGTARAAGKPAHRHAVLGHCRLFLTDVPPRNLRATVELRHVESVQILDEPAEFLQGREREEAVHVQLRFTREPAPDKSLLGSLGDLSPALGRRLSSSKTSATSLSSKKSERMSLPSPLTTGSSGSVKKSSSCLSLAHLDQKRSQSCSPLLQTKSRATAKGGNTAQSPLSLHGTSPVSGRGRREAQRLTSPLSDSTAAIAVSVSQLDNRKRWLLEKSLQPSPPHVAGASILSREGNRLQVAPGPPARLSDDSLCSSHSSPSLLLGSATSPSPSPSSRHSSPLSSSTELETCEGELSSGGPGKTKRERCVLDLYLLSPNTDFYHQLCTAWLDQKIALTMGSGLSPLQPKSPRPRDHFSHHFHSLRQELVSAKTSRESARLAQELCTACQKHFIIKRLFWESLDLVDYLIQVLHYTPSNTPTKHFSPELECRLVVLDLLHQMLRESHSLQRRSLAFSGDSGRRLRRLVTALVHLVPSLTKLESSLLIGDEVVEKACAVLSEIFRLTQQMKWPRAKGGVVSLDWTLDILAKHPQIVEFCGAVIRHESSLLQLDHLQPCQLVALYHMTHLLHCLALHSHPLLSLIQTNFSEEFKYLLSVTQARRRLPASGPLTSDTLSLLQRTKSRVLQN